MSNVIIKIDTGFVGGIHEEDTGLSKDEWLALDQKERNEWMKDMVSNRIEVYAEDEDGNYIE